ncbi:MAG: metallophosphoesterase [Eubacteriales bacterium]|nr:metallophosphoesterase [Eubacteriales bacterium]
MRILVVSDTHGRDGNLERVVEREAPFDHLIHCGDVEGRELFVEVLAECPCTIVAGNNDYYSDLLREVSLELCGMRIFVSHGHFYGVSADPQGILTGARARACEIALFGHTHRPMLKLEGGILLMNPGSLELPRQEGRCPSYGILTLERGKAPKAEIRYLGKAVERRGLGV